MSELELSEEYNCPNPLLPGTISPAVLDRAWDFLSLGPCDIDAETTASLLSLVADAALKINYMDLYHNCVTDAEIFYADAAMGRGMEFNGTCFCWGYTFSEDDGSSEEPSDD
jgi:hypothetical protein